MAVCEAVETAAAARAAEKAGAAEKAEAVRAEAMGSQCPCSGWPGTCKIPGIGP